MSRAGPTSTRSRPLRTTLSQDLARLRQTIAEMGERVSVAAVRAAWAFTERNPDIATLVIEEDVHLNELQRRAHEVSYGAILTQAPVARDLREILSLLHMAGELERMGDHCTSIAKLARSLVDLAPLESDGGLARLAEICNGQVRDVMRAVIEQDMALARTVAAHDDRVDAAYQNLLSRLIALMGQDSDSVVRATNVIFMARHLERIGDRVTNIAEDLVFQLTGQVEELG
jgi:phosphate transport system protein